MAAPPSPLPSHLYKILAQPLSLPSPLPGDLALPATALDQKDGYIHLSTHSQLAFVLARFYRGPEHAAVALVKLSYADLSAAGGALRWEPAGGSVFPHLYGGDLLGRSVLAVCELRRGGDAWYDALEGLVSAGWLEE